MKSEMARKVSIGDWLKEGADRFASVALATPKLDARILMARATGLDQAQLISRVRDDISPAVRDQFTKWIDLRLGGMPVYRILGGREFYGRWFSLNSDTLEPRPETELLVERVIADQMGGGPIRFADVGVGSGAIAATLLLELPDAKAVGTDIATGALAMARINADQLGVGSRLDLVETDCLSDCMGPFEFIVSNPPYIPSQDIGLLDAEVRDHDPVKALDGGPDGLAIFRKLLQQSGDKLIAGGRLYLETGYDQHDAIERIAKDTGWAVHSRHFDLNGLERILVLTKQRIEAVSS